jgi:hypothetical protein
VACHGQVVSVRRYILRELAETRGCGDGVILAYYAKLAPRPKQDSWRGAVYGAPCMNGNRESRQALLDAISSHPEIQGAAITGSIARQGGGDQYSDLDVLLVARDLMTVRNVRAWLPRELKVLICAFHLTNYCTILLDSFEKIDLAIFSADDPPSRWVIHDYKVLKGDQEFEIQLARAAAESRANKAVHLNPDVSIDNILLLLTTALQRVRRGEELSAHAFLTMAGEMIVSLEKRHRGAGPDADLLDPRRRLERTHSDLAMVLHRTLFVSPNLGINILATYMSERHRESMGEGQVRALEHLLESNSLMNRLPRD